MYSITSFLRSFLQLCSVSPLIPCRRGTEYILTDATKLSNKADATTNATIPPLCGQ